jgi:hypothetical protein
MLQYKPDTSLLIPYQIPKHIRENPDYKNFILFLQAYYEWLDQQNNTGNLINTISDYKDIDKVPDMFVDYYYNTFLPYFPKEILADKTKVSKVAKELYQVKGTPSSYKFLFKVLYDSDVDFLYTQDVILKTSDGKSYIAKSLRLSSTDKEFLLTKNYKIFGLTSKSIATIEAVNFAKNKIEIFISDIERLFQSGEFVKVVNSKNQDVYFKNGQEVSANTSGSKILTGKIVGQISQIKINPSYRGSSYIGYDYQGTGYPGDPIIFYGGLASNVGIGAEASVLTTTSGSLVSVNVLDGGYGYTEDVFSTTQAGNTIITFPSLPANYPSPPVANVGALNLSAPAANITIGTDIISRSQNYKISATQYLWSKINPVADANTKIASVLESKTLSTYPISKVVVNNGGGGLSKKPTIAAVSQYGTVYDISQADLKNLGILAPIKIVNPGKGYVINDVITVDGGTGTGAYAKVNTVASNGAITSVTYTAAPGSNTANNFYTYPLGGLGYHIDVLPDLNIVSSNGLASNAVLVVPGILGDGAVFDSTTDKIGQITSIQVSNYGEDYISAPTATFRIQDIVVKNLYKNNLPRKGDIVYQGNSLISSTYRATVEKVDQIYPDVNELQTLYYIRIYDYNKPKPNVQLPLLVNSKSISMQFVTTPIPAAADYPPAKYALVWDGRYDTANNIYTYGDGLAKANVTFLNGLTISDGQYLDTSGQLSSFNILQSSEYNSFTYQITLEKEIEKYRKVLLELLHPAGTKVRGRFAMKSNNSVSFHKYEALYTGRPLSSLTSSTVEFDMFANFNNPSNNIIQFSYLGTGTNIANIFYANTTVKFTAYGSYQFSSKVNTVNAAANTITLTDNVWLSFANVAFVTANANSNLINITAITNSYNIINNGIYTDPSYPLKDILRIGDTIKVNNMIGTVNGIDYFKNIFTLSANLIYAANDYMSVTKNYHGIAQDFIIYGPLGTEYRTEIVDESGLYTITDELGNILLLD